MLRVLEGQQRLNLDGGGKLVVLGLEAKDVSLEVGNALPESTVPAPAPAR